MSYLGETGKTALGVSSFVGAWSLLVSWGAGHPQHIYFQMHPPLFFCPGRAPLGSQVYVHICVYVHLPMCKCVSVCLCIQMCKCVCACIYVFVCVFVCVFQNLNILHNFPTRDADFLTQVLR